MGLDSPHTIIIGLLLLICIICVYISYNIKKLVEISMSMRDSANIATSKLDKFKKKIKMIEQRQLYGDESLLDVKETFKNLTTTNTLLKNRVLELSS